MMSDIKLAHSIQLNVFVIANNFFLFLVYLFVYQVCSVIFFHNNDSSIQLNIINKFNLSERPNTLTYIHKYMYKIWPPRRYNTTTAKQSKAKQCQCKVLKKYTNLPVLCTIFFVLKRSESDYNIVYYTKRAHSMLIPYSNCVCCALYFRCRWLFFANRQIIYGTANRQRHINKSNSNNNSNDNNRVETS